MKKKLIVSAILLIIVLAVYQRITKGDKIDKANIERAKKVKEEYIIDSTSKSNNETFINEALAAIKKEEKIKDVIITEANVLYASVLDDGTPRNGYADYLCAVLTKYKVTNIRVKIVKFGSMKDKERDNAYGILLGESSCKR